MSFQSGPRVGDERACRKDYPGFDGREGRVTLTCNKPKGHYGKCGWTEPYRGMYAKK